MLSGLVSGALSTFSALAAAFKWVTALGRRRERADAERTGAIKQREVDLVEELRKREGQLDESVNRKPGDARRRLDRGDF